MASEPSVDDLRLVLAIAEEASIGAAARRLHVSQPSASARLSTLERRLGLPLFTRDTTGARPTPAGQEVARQAEHLLGHLDGIYRAAHAASREKPLRIGTFASLAPSVFPSVEQLLRQPVLPTVSHGPELVHLVSEGSLDAAVVGIAEQMTLPRQVRVHPLGEDLLEVFRRRSTPGKGRGRTPYAGRRVLVATYDSTGPDVAARLARLGAEVELAATLPTAVAMARRVGCLAVVPRSALAHQTNEDEVLDPLPFRQRIRLSLVTPRAADPRLVAGRGELRRALHLTVARR